MPTFVIINKGYSIRHTTISLSALRRMNAQFFYRVLMSTTIAMQKLKKAILK